MSDIYDYVKYYYYNCMHVSPDEEIPKMFLKSISEDNVEQVKIWYNEFVTYIRENEKDNHNLFFNRLRSEVNKKFGTNFEPVFF